MDVEILITALGSFAAAILAAQWRLMSRMLTHYSHERKLDRASEEHLQDQLIGVLRDQAVVLRTSMRAIREKLSAIHIAIADGGGENGAAARMLPDAEDTDPELRG